MVLEMPKDWPVFKLYISIYPLTLGILIVCDCLYSANLLRFISSTDSENIQVSTKHYALFQSRVVLIWGFSFSLRLFFSSPSTFDFCKSLQSSVSSLYRGFSDQFQACFFLKKKNGCCFYVCFLSDTAVLLCSPGYPPPAFTAKFWALQMCVISPANGQFFITLCRCTQAEALLRALSIEYSHLQNR